MTDSRHPAARILLVSFAAGALISALLVSESATTWSAEGTPDATPRASAAGGEQPGTASQVDQQNGTATADGAASISGDAPRPLGGHMPPQPENIRQASGLRRFLFWLGKFHPPVINFPVGLLLGAAIAEALRMATGHRWFSEASRFCVWGGAAGAVIAAVLGWLLAGFDLSGRNWMLSTHSWLGTATALWALLVLVLSEVSHRRQKKGVLTAFRGSVFVAAALVLTTSFFGGAMIYGIDHYSWPAASESATHGQQDTLHESQQDQDEPAASVKMTDKLVYDPSRVTIQAGETVRWTNPSSMYHTVTADPELARDRKNVALPEGADTFNSGKIQAGETYSRTFTVPGHYRYFCIPHEAAGMIGEIDVRSK